LRREGLYVNHKRVYRIYHLIGLSVKRRRRRKGLATERLPLLRPDAPNLTWSMDFVMDVLASGRRIKCLTCVDDFTKECLTITPDFGIPAFICMVEISSVSGTLHQYAKGVMWHQVL
jgi:putative transposase